MDARHCRSHQAEDSARNSWTETGGSPQENSREDGRRILRDKIIRINKQAAVWSLWTKELKE